jgi:UDP:flavonoid glycosyltransferase YjiC (YdhE family)
MNSTMEALAAAVPMVAVPHTPEQRTTAERIAGLGLTVGGPLAAGMLLIHG